MAKSVKRIIRAWLMSLDTGIVELNQDWTERRIPRFTLGDQCPAPGGLRPAPDLVAGRLYGYFFNRKGGLCFVFPLEHGCEVDPSRDKVYVAGDFNGWQAAGNPAWALEPAMLDGERVLLWTGRTADFKLDRALHFKFVTGEHQWLVPPADSPNIIRDDGGNVNRYLDPERTGLHLWQFCLSEPLSLSEPRKVAWAQEPEGDNVPVGPGSFFYELKTDLPLGAIVRDGLTVFRLFAPRAGEVVLHICEQLEAKESAQACQLTRRAGSDGAAGVWEITLQQNLHGWFYWYAIDGVNDGTPGFNPEHPVLDPYARAAVGRIGPGIVIDDARVARPDRLFKTPAWQDLIIAEAHVRDLAALAPVKATADERLGFTGLRKWVESPEFYLDKLGINCVELQPVHEFDNVTREEYHWGYMTNSFFALESSYALTPDKASGIKEFQALVASFHRRGIAVIIDVVFNHVGEPAHLMAVDSLYYFERDASGTLTNWSGCGNDLRARSAMARRLIIDSCIHLIEVYGVDGFRFDLAELLGVEVLREIERAVKRVKPDAILIAEPWSFRGHIAGALRDTGWASWNDGYRDFLREYVRGGSSAERLEYFIKGSPWYFAKWPAQTVNYTESHDDRAWIDNITENPGYNGHSPASRDRRRTHLMAAILFSSVGIPMISAGQDFLRSKQGVNNTYQRGDLNALDYRRIFRFPATHAYFADWIAFRRSDTGKLLRHWSRPGEGFFQFFSVAGTSAAALLYNADRSQGANRLLFAVNPALSDASIPLGEKVAGAGKWRQLADQERFYSGHGASLPVEAELFVPALGCGLWIEEA